MPSSSPQTTPPSHSHSESNNPSSANKPRHSTSNRDSSNRESSNRDPNPNRDSNPHRDRNHDPKRDPDPFRGRTSTDRTRTKPSLPPRVLEEDDPMLNHPAEDWIAARLGTSGQLYRFSDHLVYKNNVAPREVDLMETAGRLTMRPLTRVVWKGSRPDKGTKAVIMELGRRFRGREIKPEHRKTVVLQMFMLLDKLHNEKGVVHGNIKESNFVWARDGKLRLINFSSARYVVEDKEVWNSSFATEAYFTPERMKRRDEIKSAGSGTGREQKRIPAPTVFDDYYALAITLWSVYSGKRPRGRQFNQKTIWRTDLAEVDDDMVRNWIKKVFRMAGCRLMWPETVVEGVGELPTVIRPLKVDGKKNENPGEFLV
ncbi:hypothetical protein OQA88_8440 [Cercophora sp. LCS_1]